MPDRAPPVPAPAEGRGGARASARRGPWHHVAQLCLGCAMLGLVLVVAAMAVLAAGVSAPGWLRERVATQISAALPDHRLGFEALDLGLDGGMAPQVGLRGVTLRGADGTLLADLAALDVTLSRQALLRGTVQPSRIHLEGGRLVLRRRESGALSVALETDEGDSVRAGGEAPLTRQIGALLSQPALASLRALDADNLSLRYEDARSGRAWSADGGQVSLTRTDEEFALRGNVTVLGAREYASSLEVNYTGRLDGAAAGFGLLIEDVPADEVAGQSPALAWLGALDAPISGALRAEVDAEGRLGPLNATLQIGAGALRPNPATAPIPFRAARSYFTYDPATQEISFSELSVESDWGSVRAEGRARLVGMEAGWPSGLEAQIRLGEIAANPAGVYGEPVVFEGAGADLRLDFAPFALDLGDFRLRDQGHVLRLRGQARAEEAGWSVAVDGRMDGLAPERLLALWPRTLKEKTRTWLEENVRHAELSEIQLALRATPQRPPDVFLGFRFAGLETVYVRDVPPIEGAAGHASIRDFRFVVHAERGHVTPAQGGRLDISGTSFIIPDLRIRDTPAEARLKVKGTITAALSLLDAPPFRFLEKAGRPVTLADGRAELAGRLDFLLKDKLTPEEVAFDVAGELRDMRSETLVPGRVLAARRLSVGANNGGIEIEGRARLGRVPFEGGWRMPLGPGTGGESRVRGTVELSQGFIDEFAIALPPGSVTGQGRGEVELALDRDGPGAFALTSDLEGLGLRIPQLDWALAQGDTGRLDMAGTLGTPPQIDSFGLEAGGLSARGEIRLTPEGTLEAARFSRVTLGAWLDAQVALVGRGRDAVPRVEVTGGRVDLRKGALGEGEGDGGGPVRLQLDELRVSDGIALTGFRAELDTTGGATGRFTAQVNGQQDIFGDVVPMKGRSAFRIRGQDAGRLLAAADILQDARGGTLDLMLTPAPEPGSYDGTLAIEQIRVRRAPALAALLNTVSVIGLLEQFDGQGLHFSEVVARFRLTPERLTLLESSAVGASVGISMDGYYDLVRKRMDMQGVLSPVYMLNAIGRAFTRRGEGLIGFNFTLRGPAEDPVVAVNPLSALTPGFLREMFRRPVPQVEGAPPARSGQSAAPASPPDNGRQDR